jgi:hypothetical protein
MKVLSCPKSEECSCGEIKIKYWKKNIYKGQINAYDE